MLKRPKWHFHARYEDGSSTASNHPVQRRTALSWLNDELRKSTCTEVRMIREDRMTADEHEFVARGTVKR